MDNGIKEMKTSINAQVQYKQREETKVIIIHSSNTLSRKKVDAFDLHRQACQRGESSIGFHFVIEKDGLLRSGRPLNSIGFHTDNTNSISIGICVIGGLTTNEKDELVLDDNFTSSQYKTLQTLVLLLKDIYPDVDVQKASDLDTKYKSKLNLSKITEVIR